MEKDDIKKSISYKKSYKVVSKKDLTKVQDRGLQKKLERGPTQRNRLWIDRDTSKKQENQETSWNHPFTTTKDPPNSKMPKAPTFSKNAKTNKHDTKYNNIKLWGQDQKHKSYLLFFQNKSC